MTIDEAMSIIREVCEKVSAPLSTHRTIQAAVKVIELVLAEKQSGPSEPDPPATE